MDEDTPFIGIGAIVEETEPVKTASGRITSSPSNAPNVKKIDVSLICTKYANPSNVPFNLLGFGTLLVYELQRLIL